MTSRTGRQAADGGVAGPPAGAPVDRVVVGGDRSTQPRGRRWVVAVAVGSVAVVLVQVLGGTQRPDEVGPLPAALGPADADVEPVPLPAMSFEGGTEAVLVLAAAAGWAVALDLDDAVHDVFELPGFSPQQPFDMWWLGDVLVTGSRRVYTVASAVDRSDEPIAEAHHFLPDVEPDRLWLIDHPDASGQDLAEALARREPVATSWARIDASGALVAPWYEAEPGLTPVRGVPGGLAVQDPDGVLFRYDVERGEVVDFLGARPAWLFDAGPDDLVWCEPIVAERFSPQDALAMAACPAVTVADRDGQPRTTVEPGEADVVFDAAWLSPDASHVAVVTRPTPATTSLGRELRIYGVDEGEVVAQTWIGSTTYLAPPRGDWSDDGQFFLVARADRAVAVIRWSPDAGLEDADISWIWELVPWGSGQVVALDRDQAAGLLGSQPVRP